MYLDDSWKGEHLIRARRTLTPPKPQVDTLSDTSAGVVRCAAPGCPNMIADGAPSGVCKTHLHDEGICQCHYCRNRRRRA